VLYALALLALYLTWALQLGAGRWPWWLEVGNIFALAAFAPGALLVAAALVLRSRWLRGAALVTLAVFLLQYGSLFAPRQPSASARPGLRVASFNQLASNDQVDAMLGLIRTQHADVVAIQELSHSMARAAERDLSSQYPYQYLTAGSGHYGLGILSRFPIAERESTLGRGFNGQRVRIQAPGGPVTLINLHPPAPGLMIGRLRGWGGLPMLAGYYPQRRTAELEAALHAIDGEQGALIVLGDFNMADREPLYGAFAARLTDAVRAQSWGLGFTYPNGRTFRGITLPFPIARIDYVWARGLAPAAGWTDCSYSGSDHCLVGAELILAGGPSAMRGGDGRDWR
jgi:endonuclease/exonuclease/phosphatase (EEP) superfamily protein YafD